MKQPDLLEIRNILFILSQCSAGAEAFLSILWTLLLNPMLWLLLGPPSLTAYLPSFTLKRTVYTGVSEGKSRLTEMLGSTCPSG